MKKLSVLTDNSVTLENAQGSMAYYAVSNDEEGGYDLVAGIYGMPPAEVSHYKSVEDLAQAMRRIAPLNKWHVVRE